jgi:caa(3)-type oxidase subunit IV
MSEHAHAHDDKGHGGHGHDAGGHGGHGAHVGPSYEKTFITLLVLLTVSVIGPEIGIKWLTLVTAFGIAVVKAYLVASRFMHLNIEKKIVSYLLLAALALLLLFYAGVAPDVMKHRGNNWENVAAQDEVERATTEAHNAPHAH